ncbi:hypothetical protein SNEBB_007996 [Seison nebaliae]|nr:hypothetical protein SNEBB_007996 [Seison nebaliae]
MEIFGDISNCTKQRRDQILLNLSKDLNNDKKYMDEVKLAALVTIKEESVSVQKKFGALHVINVVINQEKDDLEYHKDVCYACLKLQPMNTISRTGNISYGRISSGNTLLTNPTQSLRGILRFVLVELVRISGIVIYEIIEQTLLLSVQEHLNNTDDGGGTIIKHVEYAYKLMMKMIEILERKILIHFGNQSEEDADNCLFYRTVVYSMSNPNRYVREISLEAIRIICSIIDSSLIEEDRLRRSSLYASLSIGEMTQIASGQRLSIPYAPFILSDEEYQFYMNINPFLKKFNQTLDLISKALLEDWTMIRVAAVKTIRSLVRILDGNRNLMKTKLPKELQEIQKKHSAVSRSDLLVKLAQKMCCPLFINRSHITDNVRIYGNEAWQLLAGIQETKDYMNFELWEDEKIRLLIDLILRLTLSKNESTQDSACNAFCHMILLMTTKQLKHFIDIIVEATLSILKSETHTNGSKLAILNGVHIIYEKKGHANRSTLKKFLITDEITLKFFPILFILTSNDDSQLRYGAAKCIVILSQTYEDQEEFSKVYRQLRRFFHIKDERASFANWRNSIGIEDENVIDKVMAVDGGLNILRNLPQHLTLTEENIDKLDKLFTAGTNATIIIYEDIHGLTLNSAIDMFYKAERHSSDEQMENDLQPLGSFNSLNSKVQVHRLPGISSDAQYRVSDLNVLFESFSKLVFQWMNDSYEVHFPKFIPKILPLIFLFAISKDVRVSSIAKKCLRVFGDIFHEQEIEEKISELPQSENLLKRYHDIVANLYLPPMKPNDKESTMNLMSLLSDTTYDRKKILH